LSINHGRDDQEQIFSLISTDINKDNTSNIESTCSISDESLHEILNDEESTKPISTDVIGTPDARATN